MSASFPAWCIENICNSFGHSPKIAFSVKAAIPYHSHHANGALLMCRQIVYFVRRRGAGMATAVMFWVASFPVSC